MKVVAIVQARMESTRLPGKVLQEVARLPMIAVLLSRLQRARYLDQIVVAIPHSSKNDALFEVVSSMGVEVHRGAESDVLDRYYTAAREVQADAVVRISADCPLIDPMLVDQVVQAFQKHEADYASNVNPPTFPDGLDTEVCRFKALEVAWREATKSTDREHVTSYIMDSGQFRLYNLTYTEDHSAKRWTVDEQEDLKLVRGVFEHFQPRIDFGWLEVLALEKSRPELFALNHHLERNYGATMCSGQKLWSRAKRVILGGNMLLSKRPEMILPGRWPAYYSRAKGCRIWDLDGRELIDMGHMNVGVNTLGYGHAEVDAAVCQAVRAGNMASLNCPEEVELADRLVALHPWADVVRLARTGGEANTMAIRIARAASGREQVAVCGYHGWHDWYLAANLGNAESLAGHLLPGLHPAGVPKALADTVKPFAYNRFEELEALVEAHPIGAVMMEVMRNDPPRDGFLEKVRALTRAKGIVLIFDECTSGFRKNLGGLHLHCGIQPDMAVFGKALGNGYAISAVVGRQEVMESAQDSFMSSTFWTERIGPVAALKTLEIMERERSWEHIEATSRILQDRWRGMANRLGLSLNVGGAPGIPAFDLPVDRAMEYKTLVSQEMLDRGFLATNSVYVCTAHKPAEVEAYCVALEPVLQQVAECELGCDVKSLLKGPVCQRGFGRLN